MPDDHSNVDDDADLYGEDAYDDDPERDRLASEVKAERGYSDDDRDTEYQRDIAEDEEEDGSWWDEGLVGLLLITGTILFFFPEPFTSTLGIILLGVGVLAWAADALM